MSSMNKIWATRGAVLLAVTPGACDGYGFDQGRSVPVGVAAKRDRAARTSAVPSVPSWEALL